MDTRCSECREVMSHAERETAELRQKLAVADKWRLALESLTPGGSEFVNDLDRCLEYVNAQRNRQHEMLVKAIKERKAIEEGK